MPDFDKSKDRLIYDPVTAFEDQYTRLTVSIYAYSETGKPKLQISRERNEKGEWSFVKLGRMSMPEFAAVARAAKIAFAAVESGTSEKPAWAK